MPIPAAIELLRPLNGSITVGSVLLASWLATGDLTTPAYVAALSAALIVSFGNAHNDVVDIDVDRRAHPDRPLPSGRLAVSIAQKLAWGCAIAGLGLALTLSTACRVLAATIVLALWVYNRWAKGWPAIGNGAIAAIAASAFPFGGYAVGSIDNLFPITSFAFLLHFGREIVKDVEDLQADAEAGRFTLPGVWGIQLARGTATTVLIALLGTTPLPALYGIYGWPYLTVIAVLDIALVGVLYLLWVGETSYRYTRASRVLKVAMIVGLAAFLVEKP